MENAVDALKMAFAFMAFMLALSVSVTSFNKVKEVSVDGYQLNKIDDNNYELSVNNNVEKIFLKVVADDSKSKIKGNGEHKLEVGENKITKSSNISKIEIDPRWRYR